MHHPPLQRLTLGICTPSHVTIACGQQAGGYAMPAPMQPPVYQPPPPGI